MAEIKEKGKLGNRRRRMEGIQEREERGREIWISVGINQKKERKRALKCALDSGGGSSVPK